MLLPAIWLITGLLLMLTELIIPGFIIFFFGIGALITAGLTVFMPGCSVVTQGLCFAITSILTLVVIRRTFPEWLKGKTLRQRADADDDGIVNTMVEVIEAIEPPKPGRVAVHGASWMAVAEHSIPVGTMVRVIRRDNITLFVR